MKKKKNVIKLYIFSLTSVQRINAEKKVQCCTNCLKEKNVCNKPGKWWVAPIFQ